MPLLNDAKSCYVGTQPITTIMAGSVQVWPKVVEEESAFANLDGNLGVSPASGVVAMTSTTSLNVNSGDPIYQSPAKCGSECLDISYRLRDKPDGTTSMTTDMLWFEGASGELSDHINLRYGYTFSYWFKFASSNIPNSCRPSMMFGLNAETSETDLFNLPVVKWKYETADRTPLWHIESSTGATIRDILAPNVLDDTWHNFAFCVDANTGLYSFYFDGNRQFNGNIGISGFKPILLRRITADLGNHLNTGAEGSVYIDSLSLFNRVLYTNDFIPQPCGPNP